MHKLLLTHAALANARLRKSIRKKRKERKTWTSPSSPSTPPELGLHLQRHLRPRAATLLAISLPAVAGSGGGGHCRGRRPHAAARICLIPSSPVVICPPATRIHPLLLDSDSCHRDPPSTADIYPLPLRSDFRPGLRHGERERDAPPAEREPGATTATAGRAQALAAWRTANSPQSARRPPPGPPPGGARPLWGSLVVRELHRQLFARDQQGREWREEGREGESEEICHTQFFIAKSSTHICTSRIYKHTYNLKL